jgi:hypothetical protein
MAIPSTMVPGGSQRRRGGGHAARQGAAVKGWIRLSFAIMLKIPGQAGVNHGAGAGRNRAAARNESGTR